MTASNPGEIRPLSDRIEQAQLLIDAALALLEKRTEIDTAADTLIQAGDILAGNHRAVLRSRLDVATTAAARLFGLTMLLNDLCASKYGSYEDSGLEALAGILHDEAEKLTFLVADSRLLTRPWRRNEEGDADHG